MAGTVAVKASGNKVFHLIAPTILPSLYYDPDGTGSAKAVAFTTISKNLSMSHKDIYIV